MKSFILVMTLALAWPAIGLAEETAAPLSEQSAAPASSNSHVDPTKRLVSSQSVATESDNPDAAAAQDGRDAGGAAPSDVPGEAEALATNAGDEVTAPGDAPDAGPPDDTVEVAQTAPAPPGDEAAPSGAGEVAPLADDAADAQNADPVQAGDVAEPTAAAPAPSPEAMRCRETAGPADAGVPANADAAAARRAALAEAADACTKAARAEDAPADVLFLAAEVAQAGRDLAAAFTLLERAAGAGLAAAETRLGDYHLFGVAPDGENIEAAIARFQRAAEMGDPAGMTTLALMYRVGKGVPRDPARMVALLEDAAAAGYHFAQYRLGQTFLTGEGLPGRADAGLGIPDPARGAALYSAAAEAGNITAALELAALYGDPASGLDDDPAARAHLTSLASRSGLPEAVAAMGVLYETGDGVAQAPEIAAQLYVRALESGKVGFEALRRGAPTGWDRDTALAFQAILKQRGLYTGPLDGIVGGGTAAAARGLAAN